ncbi:MAG TPA: OmpA family protein [Arenimonas sp.]|uniref:OmpA family protein n=1 Tax=Arenimonas sp. TaxID=1872635 RepID=UPI002D7E35C2|nr:OmpA family protein [Arenimonas sp.]HEU0153995.1 OmpA family protein [Arenimonas sp.]
MKTPIKSVLSATLFTVLIAGCQSTGGYSSAPRPAGEEEGMNRTQKGAIIGAVAGAVAGLLSGDDATERRQRALVGAGVGGLAGGAIGRYQDNQERALRERMAGTGVDVVRNGDNITLDMPEAITFGFDSYSLRPGSYAVLDRVADTLAEFDQTIVEVAGHTDSIGSAAYNQKLSEQRAQAVGNYLASRGVNNQRLIITGAGANHPVASNSTEAGRAENRRVEITLVPLRS